jgi:hypothetical protein
MLTNRGMKDGQSCWMIERKIGNMPHWAKWDNIETIAWTTDPNEALHFADQASADQIANEMPDNWDVRITDHLWLDKGALAIPTPQQGGE